MIIKYQVAGTGNNGTAQFIFIAQNDYNKLTDQQKNQVLPQARVFSRRVNANDEYDANGAFIKVLIHGFSSLYPIDDITFEKVDDLLNAQSVSDEVAPVTVLPEVLPSDGRKRTSPLSESEVALVETILRSSQILAERKDFFERINPDLRSAKKDELIAMVNAHPSLNSIQKYCANKHIEQQFKEASELEHNRSGKPKIKPT